MNLLSRRLAVSYLRLAVILTAIIPLGSCNKDDVVGHVYKPIISFDDNPSGIYTVKPDRELTLAPTVTNGDDAEFKWIMDGKVVCTDRVWTQRWAEEGTYYATFFATNPAGTAHEEVRIDVTGATPPGISLAVPDEGIMLTPGMERMLEPAFSHDSEAEGFAVSWLLDGKEVSAERRYCLTASQTGRFTLELRASNADGTTTLIIPVTVTESLPSAVSFIPLSLQADPTLRYALAGRPLWLEVTVVNASSPIVQWSINGQSVDGSSPLFHFTPDSPGDYLIEATSGGASASLTVRCLEGDEMSHIRRGYSEGFRVSEWMPAPGQFIGDVSSIGGMPPEVSDMAAAVSWAQSRLDERKFVSLGSWGGYLMARFDRSIANSGGDDFAIMSNALDTSCEPGTVWVMQDINGNGIPDDDQWLMLNGSDSFAPSTIRSYSATYYPPQGSGLPVAWTDNQGAAGRVEYIGGSHNQPSYFPAWADGPLTFCGLRLASRADKDPVTGFWRNAPFDWGYVDNLGSDLLLGGDTTTGAGQWVAFRISNAVAPDGTPVTLRYIDFIKVQTAIMSTSGPLGELSTEILSIKPLP